MKAWYAQYATEKKGGFKGNSLLYNEEQIKSKTVFTKLGASLAKLLITRMLELSDEAQEELKKVDSYNFDIFQLREYTNYHELSTLLPYVLAKHGLIGACQLDITCLMNFIREIEAGYKDITYHNQTHAADVCQTFNYFVTEGGMKDKLKMDNLEQMSCLIAAALHDFEHPGVNNHFLVNMNDQIAWRHNDESVLENHHLASSFQLMIDPSRNSDWSTKMTNEDFRRCRQVIVLTVLNTDMAKHFVELGKLSS